MKSDLEQRIRALEEELERIKEIVRKRNQAETIFRKPTTVLQDNDQYREALKLTTYKERVKPVDE